MQRTELHEEITGLADSLDDHITPADAAKAFRALADRVESERLVDEPVETLPFTPNDPRYPEVEVDLMGQDASILSIVTRVRSALRAHGVEPAVLDQFLEAVISKKYNEGLHEVTCWVSVAVPVSNEITD